MTVELYEVGGAVRDELLGLPVKDFDYTVVAPGGWDEMRQYLLDHGYEIFLETSQYLTIRARFPTIKRDGSADADPEGIFGGHYRNALTADFVLARKEGEYTDGRHPDKVTPGTLEDDLRRRDFTINSLAKTRDGKIIDLFGGLHDLHTRVIKTVGTPEERFGEDALRALRAVRFAITKDMVIDAPVMDALRSEWLPPMVASISVERRREELLRAFKADTFGTLDLLNHCGRDFMEASLTGGIWLRPTTGAR